MFRFFSKFILRMGVFVVVALMLWLVVVRSLPYPEWGVAVLSLMPNCCNADIALLDWRIGHLVLLTEGETDDRLPHWSPDGKHIAYTQDSMIFTMDAYGKKQQRFQDAAPLSRALRWSPDGRKIAYNTYYQGDFSSIVLLDGQIIRWLEDIPYLRIYELDWSPDGTRLVFSGPDGLHTFNRSDSTLTHLTPTLYADVYEPRWSPDGQHIAFRTDEALYIVNPDGGGLTRLADYRVRYVAWLSDSQHLIFYNEFEKLLYQLDIETRDYVKLAFRPLPPDVPWLDFRVILKAEK
jgi:Tol biopolymer transport system component